MAEKNRKQRAPCAPCPAPARRRRVRATIGVAALCLIGALGVGVAATSVSGAAASPQLQAAPPGPRPGDLGPYTGDPLPRFVSLKADRVYFRRGPSVSHRIDRVLTRRRLPVMIIGEHYNWRRVALHDGARGWIHRAMLTSRRFATPIAATATLREDPKPNAKPTATAEPGVILDLGACLDGWCRVDAQGLSGWVEAAALWGVVPDAGARATPPDQR